MAGIVTHRTQKFYSGDESIGEEGALNCEPHVKADNFRTVLEKKPIDEDTK